MTQDVLGLLDREFAEDPGLAAGKPVPSDIALIEQFAGFALPADYRMFVEKYGAADVGPFSIYGVGAFEMMEDDEDSVIGVTKHFRLDGWPGTEDSLVISVDHAGNAITMDAAGAVRRFDHDFGDTADLGTFTSFLRWCLKV